MLVVADLAVIREGVEMLTGQALPADRPRPSEVVLLTRQPQAWKLGRRSSSPPALRSPIEGEGLSLGSQRAPFDVEHLARMD